MIRASVVFGLVVYSAGVRLVHAQADAGVAAPGIGGAGDGAAAATGASAPAADAGIAIGSGGGLFEQSQSSPAVSEPAGSAPTATAPLTINGYVRGDVFVGKVPGVRQAGMKADYGELSLTLRTAKTRFGDGFAETRVRYGFQGTQADRTFIDVREAYVNTYVGPVDLRLGQQIIVWGRADALNPTNNLTPVDFRIRSPLEDDVRLGNVGARGFLRFAPLRLEGVWMPIYRASELPAVGVRPMVSFGAPTFPSPTLGNGLVAGRLHLELPAFETSVSYLTLSGLVFDPTNPSISVSRTAYDHQVVGFDFSTAMGSVLTLRGEAAYRRPFDYQNRRYAPRPDLQYALGVDHNFGSVSVIAQYLGRYVFDWRKEAGPTMDVSDAELRNILTMNTDPAVNPDIDFWRETATSGVNDELAKTSQILFSQTAQVQHLATVRVEWLLAHETLSLSTLALVNFTTREWLLAPRIGYRLSDAVTAYLGAQVFAGPPDTLFGFIEQELSAGYAEMRFAF
jgi:hypothetical protein